MLLIIKTRAAHFNAVRETIHKVNTYELPEVLGYKVDWASPGFAQWIEKMTVAPAPAEVPKAEKSSRSGPPPPFPASAAAPRKSRPSPRARRSRSCRSSSG